MQLRVQFSCLVVCTNCQIRLRNVLYTRKLQGRLFLDDVGQNKARKKFSKILIAFIDS